MSTLRYAYKTERLISGSWIAAESEQTWKRTNKIHWSLKELKVGAIIIYRKEILRITKLTTIYNDDDLALPPLWESVWFEHPQKYKDQILDAIGYCPNDCLEIRMELIRLSQRIKHSTTSSPSFRL